MALIDVLIPTYGRKTGLAVVLTSLLSVGGFSWWHRLPVEHAGEEVLVQFLLLNRYDGCGILPCGTYHLGLPTTVEDRQHNAIELFDGLSKEYTYS